MGWEGADRRENVLNEEWDRGCRDQCPEWGVGMGKAGADHRGHVLSEVPHARCTKREFVHANGECCGWNGEHRARCLNASAAV